MKTLLLIAVGLLGTVLQAQQPPASQPRALSAKAPYQLAGFFHLPG